MQLKISSPRIWLADSAVDFRKSVNGLSEIVISQLRSKVTDGVFVFYNHSRDRIKILAWHGNGFILIYKRLEKGKFIVSSQSGKYLLDAKQLSWLLAGLDWVTMSRFNQLEYKDFY